MRPEYVDWDDPDEVGGNLLHIGAADLTTMEVEEVLDDPDAPAEPSEGAPGGVERWIVFGWTSTGKHIAVVFEILWRGPILCETRDGL